ncbi:MAG: UvrD-helicase domain-containing protein [Acidimicrobiia bacterium]
MSAVDATAALLDGLTESQRTAVTTDAAPLCILAGAGSGKTRVLTRRIAYRCATGSAGAAHVLALTFTRKAATEVVQRLRHLGLRDQVTAGTFHAVAYAQLRTLWADQGQMPPALLERKTGAISRLWPLDQRSPQVQTADLATEIEWAKARLVGPGQYVEAAAAARRRPPLEPAAMAELYGRYEDDKHRRRMVDFDDLLWLCLRAIESGPSVAAIQRWRFRHLFVDEFQDVNPLQARLLEAWRGDRPDLCVVGDPNQAIYGWNGADARPLLDFSRRWGGTTVTLADNHRSTPQVVAVANAVLDVGGLGGARLRSTRADGPVPAITDYADDASEARAVARAVRDRRAPGAPWSHQAVLTRTNAQTVLISEACRRAHIPCRVRGQTPFLELPEVRGALRSFGRSRARLHEHLGALEASLSGLEAGGEDDGDEALALAPAEVARRQNLAELLRLAGEYSAGEASPSAAGLNAWLVASIGRDDVDGHGDAVDISTLHAAKGLEWPVVHLVGLEDGLVPIAHARTAAEADEERRLFYVGVTRAGDELHLSWARVRAFGARTSRRQRSPFLDEIDPLLAALAADDAPAPGAVHVVAARQAVRSARSRRNLVDGDDVSTDEAALLDDLRSWRSRLARAAEVPAAAIADDLLLAEIVARRPAGTEALRAVPRLGPVWAERFGPDLLAIVRRHRPVPTDQAPTTEGDGEATPRPDH